ncbi:ADP-ribosylation factor-like protein 2-binding protein [Cladochytrium tenue]|nr:ADP-ribosylation factor-like protein 2-binding protein [Cladochytrium tenue]
MSVSISPSNPEDAKFDEIVGALEDLLMDDNFLAMQNSFMEKNCDAFSDDDENKLVYMDIFKSYTATLESYMEKRLRQDLPWFSMASFLQMLRNRQDPIDGDVFDMLASLGDFNAFKELIVSFKKEQDGSAVDLSGLIAVNVRK